MELRSPNPGSESAEIADVFSRSFSDYWKWVDFCPDGYFDDSSYDPAASRVAVDEGRIVAHFGVWDFSMRVGTAVVRVGGIGAVATVRDQRKQGLMTRTAQASVDALEPCGYDMSLLFGIRKFYRRFGYVGTFAERSFALSTKDLAPTNPAPALTAFEGDYREFAAQYNEENAGVTGTFVRPTYTRNRWPARWHAHTFEGGYIVAGLEDEALAVVDSGGRPAMVVDAARQLAVSELARRIDFVFLPPRGPLGEYLQTIAHTERSEFVPDGGPMIKVVNLVSLMEKLAPELTRRLGASPMAGYSGRLAVHCDAEVAELRIERGAVVEVHLRPSGSDSARENAVVAGQAFGRLVIGDDDPDRICRQSGITLTGDAVHLVPILFPDQEPSTVMWDRF